MTNLGETIESLRKEHRLSQKELGDKLNVTQAAVSSWEKNRTEPNMGSIYQMCSIFGCSLGEFVDASQPVPKYVPGSVEVLDLYSKCSKEQRQAVLSLLRSFVR